MREIITERLKLRKITEADIGRIFSCWASDAEVTKYLTWLPHESVEVTKRVVNMWLEDYNDPACHRYGIELRSGGALVGMIDVVALIDGCPVIGYVLGRAYWNQGIMTEAFGAVVARLFEEGFPAILIEADERNTGSNRVILKNGFVFERKEKHPCSRHKSEPVTVNWYRRVNPRL